jgi:hypothetical protein
MAKKFPTDEFDAAPAHGGRHRQLRTAGTRIREFFKLFAISIVVAGVGYLGLQWVQSANVFDGIISGSSQSTSTSSKTAVKVFDGTQANEAGTEVAKALFLEGYEVGSAENLIDSEQAEVIVEKSTILITDEKYRATANKISASTGITLIELTADYPDPITVVVGADYVSPEN